MAEHNNYAPQSRDDLLKLADDRGVEVQGTGADGYVKVEDLIGALVADDEARESATTEDETTAEEGPTVAEHGAERKIERQNDTAWWCPFDDHSNNVLLAACGRCGAVRDGDTASRP